jgi:hypothetical protein
VVVTVLFVVVGPAGPTTTNSTAITNQTVKPEAELQTLKKSLFVDAFIINPINCDYSFT